MDLFEVLLSLLNGHYYTGVRAECRTAAYINLKYARLCPSALHLGQSDKYQ